MKKSKMCCQFTFALFALFISSPSFAAPYGNYGQMITCTTSSNGLEFSDESRDASVARSSVTGQCRSNQRTNNSECDANIACNDGSNNRPMITCTTSSNGLEFSVESRDLSTARANVAGQCVSNQRTSNSECKANVFCSDYSGGNGGNGGYDNQPMITCTTSSNGLEFLDESRDASVARANVTGQCRSNQRTSNAECDANVMCNDGRDNRPMISCTTSSNGLEFLDESRDPWVARSNVTAQCRSNQRTSNAECDANVMCSNDSGPSYPRTPQEPPRREPIPVPRRENCVANRFDPAGRFVQSYRGQECSEAMKMCNVEIRGRQYCEIAH